MGEMAPNTPKEVLIKECITRLTYCRESMHAVLLSKWRIDELVSESMKTLVAFQRDKDEKLGLLEVKEWEEITRSAMIFTICTVVTFLLLMIRDFMTAVVGVAADMSKLISRIEPGPPDA